MGACVSVPSGAEVLPNPGSNEPWRIAIVPVKRSKTQDCFIHKDIFTGPKWLYLRREAIQPSAAATYFLESFVPDIARFPDAKAWKRGNGIVLCTAKANELGPSCYSMEEWPLTIPPAPGQYPDGEVTTDDAEMRQGVTINPAVTIQRAKWTLKAEAYIYEDAGMRQQVGTLHMRAFGKQFRHLAFSPGSRDSDGHFSPPTVHGRIFNKISGIKYWYTPKHDPEAMIPIVYRGRMLRCMNPKTRVGGSFMTLVGVDKLPTALTFNSPIFNVKVAPIPAAVKEISGPASGIPLAVGMMIAYLATTSMGPETIVQYMPTFRFPAINTPLGGPYGMEVAPLKRTDPTTLVTP